MLSTFIMCLVSVLVAAVVLWIIRVAAQALQFTIPQPIWLLLCVIVGLVLLYIWLPRFGVDYGDGCAGPAPVHYEHRR